MPAQYAFHRRFEAIENNIEFNEKWNNGTGYLDPIVHNGPKLAIGEQVKSETTNGRRLIITGSPVGNIVVFGRYSANDEGRYGVIVYNAPDCLEAILGGTSLDEGQVMLALGTPGNNNLGSAVKRIVETAAKLSKIYGE